MRYCEYGATIDTPNVVVDGSSNPGTILTLTHWPGIPQPVGLEADLSAQMAYRFVQSGGLAHVGASIVTNNHFDQDGLISMFALIDPDTALRNEELLVDVAAAGDFATYRHRNAARASMAIWTMSQPDRSPLSDRLRGSSPEQCAVLYEALLDRVVSMVLDPDSCRELWAEEDEQLTASEQAIAVGVIEIEEFAALDLAVARIGVSEPRRRGHRFAADESSGVHPMAINNATGCLRVLEVRGRHYCYTDRYETWVQYRTRRPLPRVDLRPLAEELTALESTSTGGVWSASAPSALSPTLESPAESTLDSSVVLSSLQEHLRTAPPAWNPYRNDASNERSPESSP